MIVKAKKIIGLPVFTINTGEKSGKVKDVIYDPVQNRVGAFLLDDDGLFSDERVLHYEDVSSISKDAVLTENKAFIKKIKEVGDEIKEILNGNTNLTGNRIITEEGKDLGKATDILFDTESGTVKELEVAGRAFEIFSSAKKSVPIRGIKTIGKDAVIVDELTEQVINEQAKHQGAQGMINQAQDSFEEANDSVQQALIEAKKKIEKSALDAQNIPQYREKLASIEESARKLKHQAAEKLDDIHDEIDDTRQTPEYRDIEDVTKQKWYETRQALQGRLGGLKQYTHEVAERQRDRGVDEINQDRHQVTIPKRQRC